MKKNKLQKTVKYTKTANISIWAINGVLILALVLFYLLKLFQFKGRTRGQQGRQRGGGAGVPSFIDSRQQNGQLQNQQAIVPTLTQRVTVVTPETEQVLPVIPVLPGRQSSRPLQFLYKSFTIVDFKTENVVDIYRYNKDRTLKYKRTGVPVYNYKQLAAVLAEMYKEDLPTSHRRGSSTLYIRILVLNGGFSSSLLNVELCRTLEREYNVLYPGITLKIDCSIGYQVEDRMEIFNVGLALIEGEDRNKLAERDRYDWVPNIDQRGRDFWHSIPRYPDILKDPSIGIVIDVHTRKLAEEYVDRGFYTREIASVARVPDLVVEHQTPREAYSLAPNRNSQNQYMIGDFLNDPAIDVAVIVGIMYNTLEGTLESGLKTINWLLYKDNNQKIDLKDIAVSLALKDCFYNSRNEIQYDEYYLEPDSLAWVFNNYGQKVGLININNRFSCRFFSISETPEEFISYSTGV